MKKDYLRKIIGKSVAVLLSLSMVLSTNGIETLASDITDELVVTQEAVSDNDADAAAPGSNDETVSDDNSLTEGDTDENASDNDADNEAVSDNDADNEAVSENEADNEAVSENDADNESASENHADNETVSENDVDNETVSDNEADNDADVTISDNEIDISNDNADEISEDNQNEEVSGLVIKNGVIEKYTGDKEYLIIPENVTKVANNAFYGNTTLCVVEFTGNKIITIGNSAFENCSKLKLVSTNGDGNIASIGDYAFKNCESLEKVDLGKKLKTIGKEAFYGCVKYRFIYITSNVIANFPDDANVFGNTNIEMVTFESGVTKIPAKMFKNVVFAKNAKVYLSDTMTQICDSAFENAKNFNIVFKGNMLKTIGKNAFNGSEIDSINIPASVASVGDYAYANTVTNEDVTIAALSCKFGKDVFKNCVNNYGVSPYFIAAKGSNTENYLKKNSLLLKDGDWYSVKYVLNGGKYSEAGDMVFSDLSSIKFGVPEKYGCTFLGWYTDSRFVNKISNTLGVNKNITVYAKWEYTQYNVEYLLDTDENKYIPGKNSPLNPTSHTVAKKLPLKPASKPGFIFKGWKLYNPEDSESADKIYTTIDTVNSDLTYVATWAPINYYLQYNPNGANGITCLPQKTKYSSLNQTVAFEDANIQRSGYQFAGWNTKPNGTGIMVEPGMILKEVLPSKDGAVLTLYAIWTPIEYSIDYRLCDDVYSPATNNNKNPESYNCTKAVALQTPTRKGYKFLGWYDFNNNRITTIQKGSMEDKTLFARWQIYEISLVYNGNGFNLSNLPAKAGYNKNNTRSLISISENYNIEADRYQASIRKGYMFKGWSLNSKATEPDYKPGYDYYIFGNKDKAVVTLYAVWAPIEYDINYYDDKECSVKFDLSLFGSKNYPASHTVKAAVKLTNPNNKPGYLFDGWYMDKYNVTKREMVATKITSVPGNVEDIDIYAKWKDITYSISFNPNGGTKVKSTDLATINGVDYSGTNKTVILPTGSNVKNPGYVLAGWSTEKNATEPMYSPGQSVNKLTTENKKNVVLYAVWKIVNWEDFDITYNTERQYETSYLIKLENDDDTREWIDYLGLKIHNKGKEKVNITEVSKTASAKEGYVDITIKSEYSIAPVFRYYYPVALGSNFYWNYFLGTIGGADMYTGYKFPLKSTIGDVSYDAAYTVDYEGKSYDISYTDSIVFNEGTGESEINGNSEYWTGHRSCEQIRVYTIPEDYEGLMLWINKNGPDHFISETTPLTGPVKFFTNGDTPDDYYFIKVSDLLEK